VRPVEAIFLDPTCRGGALPGHMDCHCQVGFVAECACGVTTTGGILHQARITGPESPERPIAEADFQLSREDNHPLPTRGRMPIDELLGRELLQPNARCCLDLPELRMVLWLQLVDVGFTISTGIQPIYPHNRSFQRMNCPNHFTCQFSYLVAPSPTGRGLG
jgi:hypothetical protein